MNVLAVLNLPPHMEASGAANAARSLSVALAEHCAVDLVRAGSSPSDNEFDGIRERSVVASNPLAFTEAFLPNRVRTPFYRTDIDGMVGDYDVVHLHNPIPALELRRIARACLDTGTPYVVTTHGIVEVAAGGAAYGLGRLGGLAWRKLVADPFAEVCRNASRMYALSPADIDILTDMGVAKDRISIVPNGVDLPPDLGHEELAEFAGRLGLPWPKPESAVALFVGNHTRNKGLPILLEALAGTDIPYLLVAAGSKRDHLDYEAAASTGRPDQRVIFPGFVSDEDVVALFQYADLLAFPTLADTFPLVVLEAMASRLAVLSTTVGGVPYQVNAESGTLVAPGDPEALRLAFEEMVSDRAALRAMGQAGRAHVESTFTWPAAAGLAYKGYADLLRADTE